MSAASASTGTAVEPFMSSQIQSRGTSDTSSFRLA
ncbi:MAG: hypothetical protein JWN68_2247, partial [Nocardioides sp.]|nr:hypothetical protein [Nocardioides sp.]